MGETRWMPVCAWCGEKNTFGIKGVKGDNPPTVYPELPGACHKSPTGKHEPKWEFRGRG